MFREVTAFTGAALPVRAGESDAPPKKAAQEGQFVSPCRPSSHRRPLPRPPLLLRPLPPHPLLRHHDTPKPRALQCSQAASRRDRRPVATRDTAAVRPSPVAMPVAVKHPPLRGLRARALGVAPLPLLLGERLSEQERGGPRASVRDAHARARGRPCCAQAAAAVPAADGSAAATAQATRAR